MILMTHVPGPHARIWLAHHAPSTGWGKSSNTKTVPLGASQGDLDEAIERYHQALGLKSEDTFATTMLSKALKESVYI